MDDRIDIHNIENRYERLKKELKTDDSVLPKNRALILKYLRDAELGKTILKGQKKKIGNSRNLRTMSLLRLIDRELKKPFDKVTVKDMENFILKLDKGKIKSQKGKKYSSESLMTIKKFIRKYWKWLKGQNSYYPPEVEWIDTTGVEADIKSLPHLKDDAEKMASFAPDTMKKALIMTLFDGGMREGELLNIRLSDVSTIDRDDDTIVVRIRHSKTFPRNVSLPIATPYLREWIKEHPDSSPESQLFPVPRSGVFMTVTRLGKKALKLHVTPQMMRHSSATYWAPKLDRANYCRRFGWSFGSGMPDRYIDWSNMMEKKTSEIVKQDNFKDLRKENDSLKEEMAIIKQSMQEMYKGLIDSGIADKIHNKALKRLGR